MPDLRQQLQSFAGGRVCFLGLGNVGGGDDGFGVRLAEELIRAGVRDVIMALSAPDVLAGRFIDTGFNHLVFLDAVDFGGDAGSAVLLNSQEITARFPQVSTHHISLGMLARHFEAGGKLRVWLLGVQPESLKRSLLLSPAVQKTMSILAEWISAARKGTAP